MYRKLYCWFNLLDNGKVYNYFLYLLTAGSTTTSHVHNMKNIKGHYSADAEMEHDTGTTQKTPKKKGPKTVKF